jgi:hypothetical protein
LYLNGSALRKNVSPQPSAGPLHPAPSAPKLFIGGKLCGEDLQYSPEEKEHNAKGTENETILGSEVPAGYQKRHMAAGGSSTIGAVHTLWPYLPKALASGSFPIEVAGGRGFQREGYPRSQLRHLAQKESGMRTAGYRVALLLATVVVSGSALPASGRRRQRSDLSGAHGPGNS